MGHRANLFRVEDGRVEGYYGHWSAFTLARDLFWGPAHTDAYIRQHPPLPGGAWLDEVWAEGGAILDHDRRVLLWWEGEALAEIPFRRLYFAVMREVWKGWDVRWAYEGVANLAAYLGYPVEPLLDPQICARTLAEKGETWVHLPEWENLVVSARRADGSFHLYPHGIELTNDFLFWGERLPEALAEVRGLSDLDWSEYTSEYPGGGIHVDFAGRTVEFWGSIEVPCAANRLARCWPGWTPLWHRHAFEFQLERLEGRLVLPEPTREELIARLRSYLLEEPEFSGPATIAMILGSLPPESVEKVAAHAMEEYAAPLDRAAKAAILEEVLNRIGC